MLKLSIRILTFAAIDTSSTLLFIILELLSKRPDVQAKLRTEIIDRRQGSDLSFDELINLPYLHGVYCESLRLYVLDLLSSVQQ